MDSKMAGSSILFILYFLAYSQRACSSLIRLPDNDDYHIKINA